MHTAKRHGINPVNLADALVTMAEDQICQDVDDAAAAVALAARGHLFGVSERDGAPAWPSRRESLNPCGAPAGACYFES